MLMALDIQGISLSSASACSAGLSDSSHVLDACGLDYEYIDGALRFSTGIYTTKEQIKETIEILKEIINNQRG